ncbi:hypothetical protein [Microbacterium hydrocarbonoxydans]|uniref:hypothetical protein n=1 Tax=Microbacterium hydrocarbonoxydans TaxID=273678 RepID=UPI0007BC2A05|nr:hypothetical protein [Microbacterium hydrocarbonoxydans]GAT72888.1 3-octaprenyl-4-hydroxybenzoate decarboxylase [Microbacterium sp. HM58-2]
MNDTSPQGNRLLIALSIAFSVLTLTTIGFGVSTVVLLNGAHGAVEKPLPTPTPTAEASGETTTIDGFEISAATDFTVEEVALAVQAYNERASVYAVLTNESGAEAAYAFFDVTSYREDGTIVERGLDIVYVPPGDSSILQAELPEDLSEVVSIVMEQTDIEWSAPANGGGVDVTSIASTSSTDHVEVQLTSELDTAAENIDIYVFAHVDDELVGVCHVWADIPAADGSFDDLCDWAPTPIDDPVMGDEIPEDAVFDAYVRLEAPRD